MKFKMISAVVMLLTVTGKLYSQLSADDVLLTSVKPILNHTFKSAALITYWRADNPVETQVAISTGVDLITISDGAKLNIQLPVSSVNVGDSFADIDAAPVLQFRLENGDDFFLLWDANKQDYIFRHYKWYKKFSNKKKYYPLINQVRAIPLRSIKGSD